MELSDQQSTLFEFVKTYHGDQKRKYTGAPYWTHLLSVATTASKYSSGLMEVEIALCHDLVEDTAATYNNLRIKLEALNYTESQIKDILKGVEDLTDVYTFEDYPELNRKERKTLEADRLIMTSPHSQTVKYADIIDNTTSIVEHDNGFAKIYIGEVSRYLYKLDKGNPELYRRCVDCFESGKEKLKTGSGTSPR